MDNNSIGDNMEEEQGLSLIDVWKIMMQKKFIFYIGFILTTIIVFCFLFFGYNRWNIKNEISFYYKWHNLEENSFADHSSFNYYDLIQTENLMKVKAQSESYATIDIEQLKDHIEISKDEEIYTIKVKSDIFHNNTIAKSFLSDLASLPYLKAIHLNWNFKTNLEGFDGSNKLSTKIDYLESQIQLLQSGYTGMINYFGNVHINGKTLRSSAEELDTYVKNHPISEYRYLAYQNVYLTKEEYLKISSEKQILETEKNLLMKRRNSLFESIEQIYQASNNTSTIDTALQTYIESLHQIDMRLLSIEESLTLFDKAEQGRYQEDASNQFLESLIVYKKDLEKFTDQYQQMINETLKQNTYFNITDYQVSGEMNALWISLISIGCGLFVGIILALLLGMNGYKKQKNKEIIE